MDRAVRFAGWISCRRDGEGPLGLILVGHTADRPEEAVQLAFSCEPPADLPDALEDVSVEPVGEHRYRIVSGNRAWSVNGVAHLHRDVTGEFYRALPPRSVPWRKRLFWHVLLWLASIRAGRWLLRRAAR
jgi:hypothetical protein